MNDESKSRERLIAELENLRPITAGLKDILKGARLGTWEWNIQTGETTFDDRWAEIVGYTLAELSANNITSRDAVIAPKDRKRCDDLLQRHLSGDTVFYESENRVTHKTGHTRWVHDCGQIVVRSASGSPLMMYGAFSDITKRKETEDALKRSEQKYRGIFDESVAAIYIFDAKKNFKDSNQAGLDLLGYSLEELLCLGIPDVDADEVAVLPTHRKLLSGASIVEFEHQLKRKDGTIITVLNNSHPLTDAQGAVTGMLSTLIDVTEKRRLKELESRAARLETAGTVAGQVAHDFNNLLAPLLAYPELIREELPKDHSSLMFLDDMESAARQIADINQELLTLGRRGHYKKSSMDINVVVVQTVRELRRAADKVTFDLDLSDELASIIGGPAQIARALTNMLANSLDAMKFEGTLSLRTENYQSNETSILYGRVPQGEYVKVTISDTGCGIRSDILQNILDPFFTTKAADKKRGSGLGLSVVDAVIKDHNGYLDISSKVGLGTSFYIYFPVESNSTEVADASPETLALEEEPE